ncbi:MAG: hypothetical protein KH284_02335 [Clostridiales bacterium]|nr:hypothetical protein [Clostridiales bacterium]
MKLLELRLENFKGVRQFTFSPGGRCATVFGDNGTGKTTIADAYFWLLTGKDSAGQSDNTFSVKPMGAEGLDYSVEGSFQQDDGPSFNLRRTYKDVFERRRGDAERRLKGNTTEYAIDGVPKPKKEYDAFVAEHFGGILFAVLTDPDALAGKLSPDARREILLSSFGGELDDRDVINNHEELRELLHCIGNKSVEDYAAVTREQRRKVNDRLKEIPGRIDEAEKAKPVLTPARENLAEYTERSKQRTALQNKLDEVRSGQALSMARKAISDIEAELSAAKAQYARQAAERSEPDNARIRDQRGLIDGLAEKLRESESQKRNLQGRLRQTEKSLDDLRKAWDEAESRQWSGDAICPTCGQPIPEANLEASHRKFNTRKAAELEDIEQSAASQQQQIADCKEQLAELDAQVETYQKSKTEAETALKEMLSRIAEPEPFEKTSEYAALAQGMSGAKERLEALQNRADETAAHIIAEIGELDAQIEAARQRMAAKDTIDRQEKRIEELKAEEKALSLQLAAYDKGLLLAEQFVQIKAQDIEEQVNAAFRLVRWKLFDVQKNGGIKNCCEATVNGVSYGTNLNSAAKLNAGLDIISALSKASGVQLPVWVDNAESVTELLPVDAQVILLAVSATDKTLRVEED